MAQAAAILKLSKPALTWAKGEGCKAFRGPRVYLDEFRAWWSDNGSRFEDKSGLPTKDFLDRELRQIKLRREQRDEDIELKKWLPAKETIDEMRSLAITQRSTLQSLLEMELPSKLVGQDVITITERIKAAVDKVCAIFETGIEPFIGPPPEWSYDI